MKSNIYTVIFVVLLLATACSGGENGGGVEVKRADISGVQVARVSLREVENYYETSGTVNADTVSNVSAKVMATVLSIPVKLGDRVKKGQLLMTLADADISKKVNAAEAAYKEALSGLEMAEENNKLVNTTYTRFRKLFEEKALSQQEMDEMESRKRIAESQLRQAKAMVSRSEAGKQEAGAFLSYTRITSPVNGIVSRMNIDVGSMASPGIPLVTIEDTSLFVVEVDVDERLFTKMQRGTGVKVRIDALDKEAEGIVSEIGQAIDPLSRTFVSKITLTGKGLRSGFHASVYIPTGSEKVMQVPSGAIVRKGQLTGIYAVNDENVATYRLVKTGREMNGMVEILSGLESSERVIISGMGNAIDGGIVAGL